jgi:hypothetical protein
LSRAPALLRTVACLAAIAAIVVIGVAITEIT